MSKVCSMTASSVINNTVRISLMTTSQYDYYSVCCVYIMDTEVSYVFCIYTHPMIKLSNMKLVELIACITIISYPLQTSVKPQGRIAALKYKDTVPCCYNPYLFFAPTLL